MSDHRKKERGTTYGELSHVYGNHLTAIWVELEEMDPEVDVLEVARSSQQSTIARLRAAIDEEFEQTEGIGYRNLEQLISLAESMDWMDFAQVQQYGNYMQSLLSPKS